MKTALAVIAIVGCSVGALIAIGNWNSHRKALEGLSNGGK